MRNISGLRIDWELAEGEICLPDSFNQMYALFKADVLKDWINLLIKEYNETLVDMEKEMNPLSKSRDIQ